MDVKKAVATARKYFKDVFEEEGIGKPTLEEVWFDEPENEWCITMGVHRDQPSTSALKPFEIATQVDYKTIRISDEDGKIISVKIRDIKAA